MQHGLQVIIHRTEVFAAWYACPLCKGTLCTVNQARDLDFKCPNDQADEVPDTPFDGPQTEVTK